MILAIIADLPGLDPFLLQPCPVGRCGGIEKISNRKLLAVEAGVQVWSYACGAIGPVRLLLEGIRCSDGLEYTNRRV